jgi:hypothetical protein
MTVFHFGTNDGTVPYCGTSPFSRVMGPCLPPDGTILEPDSWCGDCVQVYEEIHGDHRNPPRRRVPLCGPACVSGLGAGAARLP